MDHKETVSGDLWIDSLNPHQVDGMVLGSSTSSVFLFISMLAMSSGSNIAVVLKPGLSVSRRLPNSALGLLGRQFPCGVSSREKSHTSGAGYNDHGLPFACKVPHDDASADAHAGVLTSGTF